MCATFTEDDIGKTVEDPNGAAIGVVASVEGGTALVEPDPDATDSIKAALGWEQEPDETVPVEPSSVDVITDEAVRLESEYESGSAESPTNAETGTETAETADRDPVVEQDEDAGGRDIGAPEDASTDVTTDEKAQVEGEAGANRHEDNEDAPPHGDRTVTTERGEADDR